MKKFLFLIFLILFTQKSIYSGPFSDDLGRCLISNISETDTRILTNWIANVMIQHPQIDININEANIEFYNIAGGKLFNDLLTVRCKTEASLAVKYEAEEAFISAFELLGIFAMERLIEHPIVISASEDLINYMDIENIISVLE